LSDLGAERNSLRVSHAVEPIEGNAWHLGSLRSIFSVCSVGLDVEGILIKVIVVEGQGIWRGTFDIDENIDNSA
jgi:hypothetical protein